MRHKSFISLVALIFICSCIFSRAHSQTGENLSSSPVSNKLKLVQALMCEEIKKNTPKNPAIVFSIELGKVSCFTSFDPVPKEMFIYHKWFQRDRLSTTKKLLLKLPRWSTFSSIQLRETDKGPWRVEIVDDDGDILHVLRFSIAD